MIIEPLNFSTDIEYWEAYDKRQSEIIDADCNGGFSEVILWTE